MGAQTKNNQPCDGCATSCAAPQITRLGVETGKFDYVVALAGNPNTGKSTIFNQLTGLRQHVGNWAGKTVSRAEGAFETNGKKFKLVDLPGTYSLLSTSVDEEIARDFVLFSQPDVTVVVADATRLERSLHLILQILEIIDRVVVALNLTDEARRSNIEIDVRELTRELGIPVVPMAARRNEGINELLAAVGKVAMNDYPARPHKIHYTDDTLESAINSLSESLRMNFGDLPNVRWIALRLLEGDEGVIKAVENRTLGQIKKERRLPQLSLSEAR